MCALALSERLITVVRPSIFGGVYIRLTVPGTTPNCQLTSFFPCTLQAG